LCIGHPLFGSWRRSWGDIVEVLPWPVNCLRVLLCHFHIVEDIISGPIFKDIEHEAWIGIAENSFALFMFNANLFVVHFWCLATLGAFSEIFAFSVPKCQNAAEVEIVTRFAVQNRDRTIMSIPTNILLRTDAAALEWSFLLLIVAINWVEIEEIEGHIRLVSRNKILELIYSG
jgi:hypothetical protein